LRSYSDPAFSIALRTHPQAPRSFTASGPVYPIEELENRAWALLFAPTRMVLLVPERLANVKEVGIFYAVSRYKVIDRGTQLGGYAVEGISRLHNVGPALTVG
jgi:hypothetical protein